MNVLDQIKLDEGFREEAYPDPVSGSVPWSIGFGRTGGVRPGDTTTVAAEAAWTSQRVKDITLQLSRALPWFVGLEEPRQAVLINMAYNMGVSALLGFRATLTAVQRGLYTEAATQMLDSLWAKQVPRRAQRLAQQMRTGQWATT